MTARVEPPAEHRGVRWHWLWTKGVGKRPWLWNAKRDLWNNGIIFMSPEQVAKQRHIYWAPVTDPPRKPVSPCIPPEPRRG